MTDFSATFVNTETPVQSLETVVKRLTNGKTILDEVAEFFKELAVIEDKYSKDILKFVQKNKISSPDTLGLLFDSWKSVLSFIVKSAEGRAKWANSMSAEVEKPLRDALGDEEWKEMKKLEKKCSKAAKAYEEAIKMNNKVNTPTGSNVENNAEGEQPAETNGVTHRRKPTNESKKKMHALDNFKSKKALWEAEATASFDRFQSLEKSRLETLKTTLTSFGATTHLLLNSETELASQIIGSTSEFDVEAEIKRFCDTKGVVEAPAVVEAADNKSLKAPKVRRSMSLNKRASSLFSMKRNKSLTNIASISKLPESSETPNGPVDQNAAPLKSDGQDQPAPAVTDEEGFSVRPADADKITGMEANPEKFDSDEEDDGNGSRSSSPPRFKVEIKKEAVVETNAETLQRAMTAISSSIGPPPRGRSQNRRTNKALTYIDPSTTSSNTPISANGFGNPNFRSSLANQLILESPTVPTSDPSSAKSDPSTTFSKSDDLFLSQMESAPTSKSADTSPTRKPNDIVDLFDTLPSGSAAAPARSASQPPPKLPARPRASSASGSLPSPSTLAPSFSLPPAPTVLTLPPVRIIVAETVNVMLKSATEVDRCLVTGEISISFQTPLNPSLTSQRLKLALKSFLNVEKIIPNTNYVSQNTAFSSTTTSSKDYLLDLASLASSSSSQSSIPLFKYSIPNVDPTVNLSNLPILSHLLSKSTSNSTQTMIMYKYNPSFNLKPKPVNDVSFLLAYDRAVNDMKSNHDGALSPDGTKILWKFDQIASDGDENDEFQRILVKVSHDETQGVVGSGTVTGLLLRWECAGIVSGMDVSVKGDESTGVKIEKVEYQKVTTAGKYLVGIGEN